MRYGQLGIGIVLGMALGPIACSSSGSGPAAAAPSGSGSSGAEPANTSSSSNGGSGADNSGSGANPGGGGDTTAGSSSSGAQTPPGGGQGTPTGASGSSSGAAMPSGSGSGGGASADAGVAARDGASAHAPDDASTVVMTPPVRDGAASPADQSTLPAITVHLAGDSTMSTYTAATTQEGWGQELGQYFISKVTVDNQGQPGANIDTFYAGRWKTLINNVKAGDFVMAAFGINDSGTTHGPVAPAAFQTQMGVMADEVAAKKATFIPTTSSPLQVWVGTMETNTRLQPYCDATIALGMTKGLPVDDLNARGVAYYNMIGQTAAAALTFNGDKAHFDKQGATEMALLASQELARINSPLAAYLK
jgi:hypothetical protein